MGRGIEGIGHGAALCRRAGGDGDDVVAEDYIAARAEGCGRGGFARALIADEDEAVRAGSAAQAAGVARTAGAAATARTADNGASMQRQDVAGAEHGQTRMTSLLGARPESSAGL